MLTSLATLVMNLAMESSLITKGLLSLGKHYMEGDLAHGNLGRSLLFPFSHYLSLFSSNCVYNKHVQREREREREIEKERERERSLASI